MIYRQVDPDTKQETEDERVIAVKRTLCAWSSSTDMCRTVTVYIGRHPLDLCRVWFRSSSTMLPATWVRETLLALASVLRKSRVSRMMHCGVQSCLPSVTQHASTLARVSRMMHCGVQSCLPSVTQHA